MKEDSESDNDRAVQVRITLTLAAECSDRSLEVPNEPIAVPADTGRKGLSAILNHLLDVEEKGLSFDFLIQRRRLLRTTLEREARHYGLSLEDAIPITYFPAQQAPEETGESEQLPDWIAAMSVSDNMLFAGCYDGSIHVYETKKKKGSANAVSLQQLTTKGIGGPIKCMSSSSSTASMVNDMVLLAAGSMDHTLQLFALNGSVLSLYANCNDGHSAAVSSVDLCSNRQMASGDWDGSLCIWDVTSSDESALNQQPSKKTKTDGANVVSDRATTTLTPKAQIRAHSSNMSGVSWGNFEKNSSSLITGSWDHSIKVWDVERQDCLLTLNGSRVVSCLDTSYHSAGIVATGHPDCTIRLWDARVDSQVEKINDSTLKPSHREWIADVQWNDQNPYSIASTSHDGTVKVWDIRSPLPLHTVRIGGKGMALCYGSFENDTYLFAGGTDCIVKQFQCPSFSGKQHNDFNLR